MNPNSPQSTFARHMSDTHKVVFSKTLEKTAPIPGGRGTMDIVDGDLTYEISELNKYCPHDILVYGGATLFLP